MGKKSSSRQRVLIAQTAARLIVEEGVADFHFAKRKACERLGISYKCDLPRNHEIEAAVMEHQRLFTPDSQPLELQQMRQIALEIMRLLMSFEPRLVGPVLKGTANALSVIHLHVFSDDARSVAITLLNAGREYQSIDRRMHEEMPQGIPGFKLTWEQVAVEILVFPVNGMRSAPLSPVDGRPMKRASVEQVELLLMESSGAFSLPREFPG
jgi:hypothetical protein